MSSFNTLVLCGGGIKGLITLGALQYTIDQFLLQNVDKYIGTSIGAIICYLIAIGYTPIEIVVQLCTVKMDSFKFFDVLSLTQGKGAMSFNSIQEHLQRLTIEKIGKVITLGELKNKYNKTLICATYNLTDSKVEYLGPDNYPDMPCLIALKMSSNLPLIFEKFKYMGKYYIDGGIVENFPIQIADREEDKNIFGIVTFSQRKCLSSNIFEYAYDLLYIPTDELSRNKLSKVSSKCKILKITTKTDLKPFELNISSTDKLNLFSRGYNKAKKFFNPDNSKTNSPTE